MWLTTQDGTRTLDSVPVAEPDSTTSDAEVQVADAAPRQQMAGFGAALTHSSADLLAAMGDQERSDLLADLFAPDGPVRLSVVRVPLGGSDFVTEPATTYDDLPPGETDWDLEHFSTGADEDNLRAALRQIRGVAPNITVIAAPWSPPAWLKSSGSLEGGRLLDDRRAAPTYARYLLAAVREWAAAGVPIDYLSVQNEPQARSPDGYPGTDMPVADEVAVLEVLGPALRANGLATKLLAYDHNWSLHPADAASTPAGRDPEADYPARILSSPAAAEVSGTAFHCYSGDASAQTALRDRFPDKEIWVTECSGSHEQGATPREAFAATLAWQSQHLVIDSVRNWARAVLTWNLALDPSGGPHVGGCATCTGLVTIAPDGTVTRNAEYYVLAHAARFVPEGATVLLTTGAEDRSLATVAFRTPSGALVVLAYNAGPAELEVTFVSSAGRIPVLLPARSLATIVTTPPDESGDADRPRPDRTRLARRAVSEAIQRSDWT